MYLKCKIVIVKKNRAVMVQGHKYALVKVMIVGSLKGMIFFSFFDLVMLNFNTQRAIPPEFGKWGREVS